MAGGAHFLVHLEAALQLLPVELPEEAGRGQVNVLWRWNSCSADSGAGFWIASFAVKNSASASTKTNPAPITSEMRRAIVLSVP
jgi:hypothetical protein